MLETKIQELIEALNANTAAHLAKSVESVSAPLDDIQVKAKPGRTKKDAAPEEVKAEEPPLETSGEASTEKQADESAAAVEPSAFEAAVVGMQKQHGEQAGFEVIKGAILAVAKKNRPDAEALLASFGVPKISQLTPEQYPAAFDAAQKLLA